MGAIGTQVVVERLVVTDIDKYFVKNANNTVKVQRNWNTALDGVLQQSDRFETDRFTSGVGSGYKQNSVILGQFNVERNNLSLFSGQVSFKQRMSGIEPVKHWIMFEQWLY
jgi:hypothetical protein